ncbi:MAG: sigma factor-like helix-turn-helix DNA-binding protein [Janthinobacterium lividum]
MKLLQMPCRNSGANANFVENQAGVLPQLWATEGNLAHAIQAQLDPAAVAAERERSAPVFRVVLSPQTAFYRTYTEAMLRRYGVLSLESGRVPSMLGREMFRGKVTSYRVHAFDDVVIFVHDVEQCIRQLKPEQQRLIQRIGVQEYTFAEAAPMLQMSLRSVQRRYHDAVDELTTIFLERKLLERIATDPCQDSGPSAKLVSHSPA